MDRIKKSAQNSRTKGLEKNLSQDTVGAHLNMSCHHLPRSTLERVLSQGSGSQSMLYELSSLIVCVDSFFVFETAASADYYQAGIKKNRN